MISKPTFLETDIWAKGQEGTGHIVNPDNVYKNTGWIYGTKPPYTVENWIQNTKDNILVHLNQNGIMEWDISTSYAINGHVNYNQEIYIAKTEHTGTIPTAVRFPPTNNNVNWDLDIPVIPDNIVIDTEGVVDANKIVMTNSDGILDLSLTALGGMVYNGDIDITIPHPDMSSVDNGDYYTVAAAGTFEASWTGLAGTDVEQSETFIYDGTQWNMLGSGVNDNYLLRNGTKPMIGNLIVGVDDATSVATNLYGNVAVGSALNPWVLSVYGDLEVQGVSNLTGLVTTTAGVNVGTDLTIGSTLITGLDNATNNTSTLYGDTTIGSGTNNRNLTVNGNTETSTLSINGVDSVEIIEDTIGLRVLGGNNVTSTYNDTTGETTIDHDILSTQASIDNSGSTVIQDISLDEGHVTLINSVEITSTIVPYDNIASGLSSTFVKNAIDELDTNTDNVISGTTNITYDNVISGITATTIKTAIDEISAESLDKYPTVRDFDADGVSATFSPTGGYAVGEVDVYVHGVKLRATEFTATDGINVVLNQVPNTDAWVQTVAF